MENTNKLAVFVNEARKPFLHLGIAVILCTIGFYFVSPLLLAKFQQHLNHQQLAFFTVAEPFVAHAKLAFFLSLYVLVPWISYWFWRALATPFNLNNSTVYWFSFFSCFLFYGGTLFCYFITLPFGVNFLLGFQSEHLQPVISIGRFITFVTVFILAFGFIFELPVFMVFSTKTGLCPRKTFEQNRRYAALAISILAAILTPTPDVVNMLLMGGPLYILYELGIIVLKLLKLE